VTSVEFVVAIAGDDEGAHAHDSAAHESQDVECGVVGPLHVLEDDDRRAAPIQFPEKCGCHGVSRAADADTLLEVAAGDLCDVRQRAERPQREERVAVAPQDPRLLALAEAA
jgi:hypothetical protein